MAYTKNATWVDSPSIDTLVTAAKLNNIEDGIYNAAATADAAVPKASGVVMVDAGSNLSTARPTGAGVVYWMFDNGTDVGADGANVVNGVAGDLYYVAGA